MAAHVPVVVPQFWAPFVQQMLPGQQVWVAASQRVVPQSIWQTPPTQDCPTGQTTGLPPVQTPAWQVSVWVQALPSSQGVPSGLGRARQPPVAGSLSPSWQASPALAQSFGSPTVQGSPSSHEASAVMAVPQIPPDQVAARHRPCGGGQSVVVLQRQWRRPVRSLGPQRLEQQLACSRQAPPGARQAAAPATPNPARPRAPATSPPSSLRRVRPVASCWVNRLNWVPSIVRSGSCGPDPREGRRAGESRRGPEGRSIGAPLPTRRQGVVLLDPFLPAAGVGTLRDACAAQGSWHGVARGGTTPLAGGTTLFFVGSLRRRLQAPWRGRSRLWRRGCAPRAWP
jgi:hypothetical protein